MSKLVDRLNVILQLKIKQDVTFLIAFCKETSKNLAAFLEVLPRI